MSCVGLAFASESCFVVQENGRILRSEGDCAVAYAPESTFKIPLSLVGFDHGILKNVDSPSWLPPSGITPYINVCKGGHTPRTWMRDSCLWYSQILTTELGIERLRDYVTGFSYGNMDLSGGITGAWISSSLQISPLEQVIFLQKVLDCTLPVSKMSCDITKQIMYIQELPGGWKLYGKTGSGRQTDRGSSLQHGWFVGYIEKIGRKLVFASHIVDSKKQTVFASFRARNEALVKLWELIEEIEQ